MSNKFVNKTQVGGRHYVEMAMQPWELIELTCSDFWYGTAVEYISRWDRKDGVKDLRKARHVVEHMNLTHRRLWVDPMSWHNIQTYVTLNHMEPWQRDVLQCLVSMEYNAVMAGLDRVINRKEAEAAMKEGGENAR